MAQKGPIVAIGERFSVLGRLRGKGAAPEEGITPFVYSEPIRFGREGRIGYERKGGPDVREIYR